MVACWLPQCLWVHQEAAGLHPIMAIVQRRGVASTGRSTFACLEDTLAHADGQFAPRTRRGTLLTALSAAPVVTTATSTDFASLVLFNCAYPSARLVQVLVMASPRSVGSQKMWHRAHHRGEKIKHDAWPEVTVQCIQQGGKRCSSPP
jgi:hypothetical protein